MNSIVARGALVCLAACRADPGPEPHDQPPPYLSPPATTTPPFVPAEVEAGLADVIALVPTLSADPALETYGALRSLGDESCPPSYPYDGYEYWYAQCTADSGAVFTGYAYDYLHTYGWGRYSALYIAGSVIDPGGQVLEATGAFTDTVYEQGRRVELDGVFRWPDAEGTWIARGLVPSLETTRERHGDRRTITINGGLAGFGADPDTVEFTQVSYDTDDGCAEPTGTVSVRVAGGAWFDLAFGDDCDGCADATYEGLPAGRACADFSPWSTWETP